jgi:hypothetical protein
VEQLRAVDAKRGEGGVESTEVVYGGLVRADVLGGDDGGEVTVQPLVAARRKFVSQLTRTCGSAARGSWDGLRR